MGILDNMMRGYSDRVLGPQAPDPNELSDAYKKIQDTLATNRSTQEQTHALDPNPEKGEYKGPNELERWKNQIDAMIKSGNPQLQKEGISQLQSYQERNTTAPAAKKQSDSYTKASEMFTPGTKEHRDYMERLNFKTSKMFESSGDIPYSPAQLKLMSMPDGSAVPLGTTPNQAQSMGINLKQDANQMTLGSTTDNLELGLEDLYSAIDEGEGQSGTGVGSVLRNISGVGGEIINAGMNLAGMDSTENQVKFTNANRKMAGAIVKMMSGAAATDAERSFWEQIQPRETDTDPIKRYKYDAMVDFAESLADRARTGGVTGIPDFSKVKRFGSKKPKTKRSDIPKIKVKTVNWGDMK